MQILNYIVFHSLASSIFHPKSKTVTVLL